MKKILLSFLALIAMVGMVNAQRAWAYGLNMSQEGDNYTFVFKSTTAATAANLVFTDAAGEVAGKVALENVVAGENTKVLALADIPGEGTLNWAVELTGAAIDEVSVISSSNKIYFPQGVVANVNTESDYFGSVYVANAQTGTPGGTSTKQLHGIFEYTQTLEPVNPTAAYAPSNLDVTDAYWDGYHRIAIDPTKDILAFAKWDVSPFSVYGMNLANMSGEATNLTPDVNQPTSLCYDANGVMYVLSYDDPTRATAKYGIHKVVDGVSEEVFTNSNWVLKGHNQIACDGHGGFWVASYSTDASTNLHHVGKNGIDLKIVGGKDTLGMPANFVRGQLAYDLKRDVLAVAGDRKVTLYNVVYNVETGAPTLTKWTETRGVGGKNVDGVAFDYSGDLLVASASVETLFKFALPTAENTCTTPAPKAQVVVKEVPTPTYTVTVTAENGSVEGLENEGVYEAGASVTLTATADDGYDFVNWTENDVEVYTEANYSFEVLADRNLVANFKKSVVTHDFYVEDVTVTEGQWSIDLAGSWNEQAFVLKLWQDNTQGFGTYAANAETGYTATLGVKELTPTAPGYYTDMQDGTFTFQGTMTDGTDIYEVYLKGALGASSEPETGELEAKSEVDFTYEDGEWTIEAFADDDSWKLALTVTQDPETMEWNASGEYTYVVDEENVAETVSGTGLLYFDDFSGCQVFRGTLTTESGEIYPTLYASSLTLMTNELMTAASSYGEIAGVDYYEVYMWAADDSWELDLHARNCTGANGTYTIDVVDEAEYAYSTFMSSAIVTGELTIEDGMYEANVTTVDSEGNPAMSISVLAWAAAAEEYDIVITDATVTDNTSGYNIDLTGEWEGHDIKVEVCDELTAETILANFFFDGGIANDGDQAEGEVTATVSEGVVTITGTFESGSGNVYNVTISGTLPVVEEPEVPTALDNIDSTVAPVKAIVNGQLIIKKGDVQYNAQGAVVK